MIKNCFLSLFKGWGLATHTVSPSTKAPSYNATFKAVAANIAARIDGIGIIACPLVTAIVVIAIRPESVVPKQCCANATTIVAMCPCIRCCAIATDMRFAVG